MSLSIVILAFVMPWLLGFVGVKAFLKQRYGYISFAIGAGYFFGYLLQFLIILGYRYWQRPVNGLEILAIESILFIIGLFFSAKPCAIHEFRLEKATSNSGYWSLFILGLLFFYHVFFVFNDSLSAINSETWKIHIQHISKIYQQSKHFEISHLTPIVQLHWLTAYEGWQAPWINLSFLSIIAATTFVLFACLRYMGARRLPAALGSYLFFSLSASAENPFSLSYMVNSYWGLVILLLLALLIILTHYQESRLLSLLLMVIVLLSQFEKAYIAMLLSMVVAVILVRLVGLSAIMIISLCAISALLLLVSAFLVDILPIGKAINTFWQGDLPSSHWLAFYLVLIICLVVLIFYKKNYCQAFILLAMAGVSGLMSLLIAWLFFPRAIPELDQARVMFSPILALIPVATYHLVDKDDETIPVI